MSRAQQNRAVLNIPTDDDAAAPGTTNFDSNDEYLKWKNSRATR